MADVNALSRARGRMPLAPVRRTGGWKLAYADFLTALCALFLVLWLVHGATPEQKQSVANEFGAAPVLSAMSLVPQASEAQRPDQLAAKLQSSALFDQNLTFVSLQKLENGVRIELMDLDRAPLFEKGSPTLNRRGRDLIALTASALSLVDFSVSIEGHTDSDPVHRAGYSNWDLSSDRANAARRALLAEGLEPARIRSVAGLADTRPLNDAATSLPQNRRLSIVVHLD